MLRKITILAMLFIVASVITLSLIPIALGQSYSTTLVLDPLPSQVNAGDTITFKGVLKTTDGRGVSGATIYIKDDVDFGSDKVIGAVVTDEKGWFGATWTAIQRSSGAYDFYVVYDGNSQLAKA